MHVVPRKQRKSIVFDAQVVELVDTLASGASARKGVEVRVFFWAPIKNSTLWRAELRNPLYAGFLIPAD